MLLNFDDYQSGVCLVQISVPEALDLSISMHFHISNSFSMSQDEALLCCDVLK